MKKLIQLLAILIICQSAISQTIRRCNNTGNASGALVYPNLQAAVNASDANDIIYLDPSVNNYGNATINKKLTIIGAGYFLGENQAEVNSQNTLPSTLGIINFNGGSEGSKMVGVRCVNYLGLNTSSLTLDGCFIFGGLGIQATGSIVRRCYFSNNGNINGNATSGLVTNCRLTSNVQNVSNISFENNVFVDGGNIGSITNCSFTNNIFYSTSSLSSLVSPSFNNNISIGAQLPAGNGNVNNADPSTLFAVASPGTFDAQYKLAIGSPAIGAGLAGVDCGMFGGLTPYKLSGVPSGPIITNFGSTSTATATIPVSATISAKSN